jgi:DNA-binding transcriptional LysR family regulator
MEPDRWLGVELRHLAALQAIASEGSFGRAATRLGYTQSAISQQIAALERIVGERLLERPGGPRPVSLTEAGRVLVGHADSIMSRLRAAEADLAALGDGTAGTLRVGTYQSAGARILPELMRRFGADWPDVDVHLSESDNDGDLLELVERGELDLTFTMLPLDEGPFEAVELLRDPYVLLVRADSPLVGKKRPPTLREIAEVPLIGMRKCRSATQIESFLRHPGIQPQIVFRSDDNGTTHGLVAAGVGVALVPRLTIDWNDTRLVALDLDPKLPPRLIAIAWHRDRYRSPAARAFVEAAQQVCAGLEALPAPVAVAG